MEDKHLLIYDSECGLCVRFKKALEFLDKDKKINFRSVYDQSVYVDYPELKQEECEEMIHMVAADGKILKGSDVVSFLIQLNPGVKKFSWLIESDSAEKAMGAFYGRLNEMRIMRKRKCFTCGRPHRKK